MIKSATYAVGVLGLLGFGSGSSSGHTTDLGTFDGNACSATGVNDSGAVVGSCRYADGNIVTAYWAPDTSPVRLPRLVEDRPCSVTAINNAGAAVGSCEFGDVGAAAGVRWRLLPMQAPEPLQPREGDVQSRARLVNERGVAAGSSRDAEGARHAVVWKWNTATPTDLPELDSTTCNIADMSDDDDPMIVGTCDLQRGGTVAVRWTPSGASYGVAKLVLPPNTTSCWPVDVNGQHLVAGTCQTLDGSLEAVRWRANGTEVLVLARVDVRTIHPMLTVVDMSESGTITGNYVTNAGLGRAFVWSPVDDLTADQRGIDLGTLGGFSTRALGISEDGSILGTGQNDQGRGEAFVWNPRSKKISGLGTLGGYSSHVTARSRSGQVAGVSQTEEGYLHAFIVTEGDPSPPPSGGCNRARGTILPSDAAMSASQPPPPANRSASSPRPVRDLDSTSPNEGGTLHEDSGSEGASKIHDIDVCVVPNIAVLS